VNTDLNNCGRCGGICGTPPHATATCASGSCAIASCSAGFSDCDGQFADGCEVPVAAGCGTCASPCSSSDRSCNGNTCVVCATNEVGFGGKCYYLDGSGGCCQNGFARVSQSILASIGPLFAGKSYKNTVSSNCCIWNADAVENYGVAMPQCNHTGAFGPNDVAAGASGCVSSTNYAPGQLTLCGTGVSNEVPFNGHCYYLDGSNSVCDPGYALASQSVLASIGAQFVGKLVKHTAFNNCCVANADGPENYGMGGADCFNFSGPWGVGPVLGGAGCTNSTQHFSQQLSLCGSP
jgi:hypothetical protein